MSLLQYFFVSLVYCCSPCTGEGQGEHSAPDELLFWQQLVHKPQRERRVCFRRRVRLQLRIGAWRAAQQKEAARGAQLDSGRSHPLGSPNRLFFFCPPAPGSSYLSALSPASLRQSRRQGGDCVIEVLLCIKRFYLPFSSWQASCHSFCGPATTFKTPPLPKVWQLCSFEGLYAFQTSW